MNCRCEVRLRTQASKPRRVNASMPLTSCVGAADFSRLLMRLAVYALPIITTTNAHAMLLTRVSTETGLKKEEPYW